MDVLTLRYIDMYIYRQIDIQMHWCIDTQLHRCINSSNNLYINIYKYRERDTHIDTWTDDEFRNIQIYGLAGRYIDKQRDALYIRIE